VVERDERALALAGLAQLVAVRAADEVRPVAVHGLRPRAHGRVLDVLEERRRGVKVGERDGGELEALALEVRVGEVEHGALGAVAADGAVEGGEHGLRGLGRRLVDDRLRV
jgi:hypothetical protein